MSLTRVTPILFVRDVEAAARFYAGVLGFKIDFLHGDPPFYGAVSRDGVVLHLRHVDQPNFAELAARVVHAQPALRGRRGGQRREELSGTLRCHRQQLRNGGCLEPWIGDQ